MLALFVFMAADGIATTMGSDTCSVEGGRVRRHPHLADAREPGVEPLVARPLSRLRRRDEKARRARLRHRRCDDRLDRAALTYAKQKHCTQEH